MTLTSVTEYATEHFVSYYYCELGSCDKKRHTCPKCPESCEYWKLRYRCRLGCLTEEELADFRQESGIDNFPLYLLQSVNELFLEIRANKIEHIQARENYESLLKNGSLQSEILQMEFFETTAKFATNMRLEMESRYGESPCVPYFVNGKVASGFYKMERAIIEGVIKPKLQALKREGRELCVVVLDEFEVYDKEEGELTEEERTRLAEIGKETRELNAELKEKLQELQKLHEVIFTQIALPVIVDESMAVHKEGVPTQSSTTGTQKQKSEPSQPKKQKPTGSGQPKIYDRRLPALFEDLERRVYDENDPLTPADAYRYTKKKIAEELKSKYPNEFKGEIESIEKQIQTKQSWKKWRKKTRKQFINEGCDGLNRDVLRYEKFEGVVLDYLAYVRSLKDKMRETKHNGMYDKVCVGMSDGEYRKFANRITPKMAAQWAKKNETDYAEIGEIVSWSTDSLATEFAKTSEWNHRWDALGVPRPRTLCKKN